jgi:hypothetical protein
VPVTLCALVAARVQEAKAQLRQRRRAECASAAGAADKEEGEKENRGRSGRSRGGGRGGRGGGGGGRGASATALARKTAGAAQAQAQAPSKPPRRGSCGSSPPGSQRAAAVEQRAAAGAGGVWRARAHRAERALEGARSEIEALAAVGAEQRRDLQQALGMVLRRATPSPPHAAVCAEMAAVAPTPLGGVVPPVRALTWSAGY